MRPANKRTALRIARFALPLSACAFCVSPPARCQDSSAEMNMMRGDRPEISVTVRDSSGAEISAPAMVKIYKSGVPTEQGPTRKGRAFFMLNETGEYSVSVTATGYEAAQKEVSIPVALKTEVEIVLKRLPNSNETSGVPGKPVLAPKAQEAFDKALQALSADKLKDANKYAAEAMKLAPGHPDVLYLQGVLDLKERNYADAQIVLEKATQLDPSHAHAFAALGMTLSDEGQYAASIAPLEQSLKLEAKSGWETHWALAKAYYHQQQFDGAVKESQAAVAASNGKAPEVELLLAQSLTAAGHYEEAAQVLRNFIKNHGDRKEAATAQHWLDRLTADGKIHK
jgi:thioredoxin-like negative regulator of GroEL